MVGIQLKGLIEIILCLEMEVEQQIGDASLNKAYNILGIKFDRFIVIGDRFTAFSFS